MDTLRRYPLSLSEESPPSPASVRSYQSSRRSRDLSDWQAEDVGHFLHRLGLDNYVDVFESAGECRTRDQDRCVLLSWSQTGIDGQTLMFLDHESLKDLGLAQVGLRLRILKAVYEVKIRDGIALDDEDWLPAGVQPCTGCSRFGFMEFEFFCDSVWIFTSDERIGRLENEYDALRNEVEGLRVVVNAILPRKNESHHSQNTYLNGRRPTLTVNTKRQQNRNASRPASLTPTASAPRGGLDLSAIPMSGMPTGVVMPMTTATPQDETGRRDYFDGSQTDSPAPLSPYEQPRTADKHPQTPLTKRLDEVGESASPKNGNKDGPPTPRKAPHDTCLQVLPAAVKKYNLKHPWFQYTMIVTTPNGQKRALAYDERPRQIVHDLRSQGEKPSCLVQHQSELRSPLALSASRKAKLFRRYIDGSDNPSISIPSQILPTLEAGRSLSDDMRERLPPVGRLPFSGFHNTCLTCKTLQFARFAFAIYSWMAEGDGETDAIEYGDCFMVSDKRDGMLEVQRVSEGETGSSHLKIPVS